MAKLATQQISTTGLAPTYTAASAGGDTFANNGTTMVHVKNGGTAAVTVTIDSIEKCSHGFDHDLVVTVAANGEQLIGPLDASRFNNKATGLVSMTYSGVTTVTVAVLQM